MTQIKLRDLRNGYVRLVTWLMETGGQVESRDAPTIEQTGVTIIIDDPTEVMLPIGVGRKINVKLAAVEALQLMAGVNDDAMIRRAAPTYADVLLKPDDTEYGSYGRRLRFQLEQIYRELFHHPTSRRAVGVIWREDDLIHDGDRPCTLSLQFLLRNNQLECHATMRSQDVWLGTPYDIFMFTQLQLSLARQLGVGVGKYVHHVGSLHIWQRDLERASGLHQIDIETVGFPQGVISPVPEDLFTETATYLVENSANEDEMKANPWYVDQLLKVGFSDTGNDEVTQGDDN